MYFPIQKFVCIACLTFFCSSFSLFLNPYSVYAQRISIAPPSAHFSLGASNGIPLTFAAIFTAISFSNSNIYILKKTSRMRPIVSFYRISVMRAFWLKFTNQYISKFTSSISNKITLYLRGYFCWFNRERFMFPTFVLKSQRADAL